MMDNGIFGDYAGDDDSQVDDGNNGDYDGDHAVDSVLATIQAIHERIGDVVDTSTGRPQKAPNVKHSAKSVEWYTSEEVLELERRVIGDSDFDPFSSELANETVMATEWLGKGSPTGEDGFNLLNWPSFVNYDIEPFNPARLKTVHCNPPGGKQGNKSQMVMAWKNLMEFRKSGYLRHAIFIAFSIEALQTSQSVSPSMMEFPICVPSKRLRFVSPEGTKNSPTHANAIIYVPGNTDGSAWFKSIFSELGACR